MQSTTRAEADARTLGFQVGILKVGIVVTGAGALAVLAYEGGRALHWWK
jgi:hypothetical protein